MWAHRGGGEGDFGSAGDCLSTKREIAGLIADATRFQKVKVIRALDLHVGHRGVVTTIWVTANEVEVNPLVFSYIVERPDIPLFPVLS